jgi:NADH dehydrogenase
MKIFLSGGTGFVGEHLRRALLDRGVEIRLLVRKKGGSLEQCVEAVEGDITLPGTFSHALSGCDAAINLVGIIREFPARGITFERLHVEGAKNMLHAARSAGVRRYIHMSALGARPGAVSAYHRSKFCAEELVCASGLDWTIFRPSIIFGPGDEFVNRLAGFVRSLPAVPVIGDGSYRLQPIAVADVARCFTMALEMPETCGKTYELCGPDRFTYNELLDTIGCVLGRQLVRKVTNPLAIMKVVVPLLQGFSFFPVTMDQILMLLEENICDGKWRETFRFEPQRFADGISRYLQRRY